MQINTYRLSSTTQVNMDALQETLKFNEYYIALRHWIGTLMLRILNVLSNFKHFF
jgi:hypothetical protein